MYGVLPVQRLARSFVHFISFHFWNDSETDILQMREKLWLKEIKQLSKSQTLASGRGRIQSWVFKLLNQHFLYYLSPFQSKTV